MSIVRPIKTGSSRHFSVDGVKQVLMAYHGQKHAAIARNWAPKPGFLYSQVRAITARINQNYDAWPSEELKKSYRSFIGKPIFVNHTNEDWKKARGKVIAARYVEAGDDRYIETIMEVDAQRFPKLAKEIREGGLDSVSMGVECAVTICSHCGNRATDEPEFCEHVAARKGEKLYNPRTGRVEPVHEICEKLGFFELSYVFDPADETALVSRVIAAGRQPGHREGWDYRTIKELPPEEEHPSRLRQRIRDYFDPDKFLDQLDAELEEKRRRHHEGGTERRGYGEVEAPEDIDTLRREDLDDGDYQFITPWENEEQDDVPFQQTIRSPKELRTPDLSRTKQLDREQEEEGLDADRRAEDVEDVDPEDPRLRRGNMARTKQRRNHERSADYAERPQILIDPRTGRRYVFAEEDDGKGLPPWLAEDDDSDSDGSDDSDGDEDDTSDSDESDDGDYEDDDSGSDDGDSDDSGDSGDGSGKSDAELLQEAEGDLQQAEQAFGDDDEPLQQQVAANRKEKRKPSKEAHRMSGLTERVVQASRHAKAPQQHFADSDGSGDVEGGPYHTDDNDQGEQEPVYVSQTPGGEAVEAPRDGDSKITNTPDNLVASLRRRIRGRSVDLERDIQAYRALTGSDECGSDDDEDDKDKDDDKKFPWDKDSRRRTAAEATTDSRVLDPPLSGTDDQDIKGHDFTDVELVSDSTQPKDASVRAFAAFDDWMRATTGRSATAHHPNFVRRQAARYAEASGVPLQAMFPALEVFLRRARRAEVDRREAMDRRANESLEVAAPDERVDVEAPVNDTTDQRAQQSQYDIGEFGQNAGDSVAKPDLSTNSQIWAPGEGGGTSDREERAASFNRKADAVAAVRYAEAYINSGLPYEDKWQLVAQAQQMRHATIVDRTRLLEAVAQANATRARSASRRLAAASGAAGRIPPGLTSPRTAPSNVRYAATDPSNDSALFI